MEPVPVSESTVAVVLALRPVQVLALTPVNVAPAGKVRVEPAETVVLEPSLASVRVSWLVPLTGMEPGEKEGVAVVAAQTLGAASAEAKNPARSKTRFLEKAPVRRRLAGGKASQ